MREQRLEAMRTYVNRIKHYLGTDILVQEDLEKAQRFFKWGYSPRQAAIRIFEQHPIYEEPNNK